MREAESFLLVTRLAPLPTRAEEAQAMSDRHLATSALKPPLWLATGRCCKLRKSVRNTSW